MATLKSLAGQLGLSITTVSRALDDYDDVAAATKLRVRSLARELNYRPNAAARSLRRQKTNAVAVALPANSSPESVSSFFNMLMDVGAALAAQGLDLLMLPAPAADNEMLSLQRLVEGRRVDAVILVRTRVNDPRVAFLEATGLPFVTHGRTAARQPHAYIDGDGEQGFREAACSLIELGHRRIAHIAAPQELMFAKLRRKGWLTAMREAGLKPAGYHEVASPTEIEGQRAARQLLRAKSKPTALICATDIIAIGAMVAAKELGLRPGPDVTIIGHDGLQVGAFSDPPLSTMEIASHDVGERLAGLLLARMEGVDPRDLQVVLPVRQVPRATHGPPRT